jgi:hypothetical protein
MVILSLSMRPQQDTQLLSNCAFRAMSLIGNGAAKLAGTEMLGKNKQHCGGMRVASTTVAS